MNKTLTALPIDAFTPILSYDEWEAMQYNSNN